MTGTDAGANAVIADQVIHSVAEATFPLPERSAMFGFGMGEHYGGPGRRRPR